MVAGELLALRQDRLVEELRTSSRVPSRRVLQQLTAPIGHLPGEVVEARSLVRPAAQQLAYRALG